MNKQSVLKAKHRVVDSVNKNRLGEAGKAAEKLCRACPGDPESWCLLGFVEDRRANARQAVAAYSRAVKLNPGYYEAAYNLGCNLIRVGDFKEAEKALKLAHSIRPDIPDVVNNLGIVFRQQGDLEQAVAHFRKTIQIDPRNAMALQNLGNALVLQEKADEALAYFRRVVSINPKAAEAFLGMGNAFRQIFLREQAVSCYRRVLEIDPENPGARFSLANTLILLGKFDEAVDHFNAMLDLKPEDLDALAGKVEALEKKGDRRSAFESIRSVREGTPFSPRLALTYANLCHEFEVCDDAMVWIDALLENGNIYPEDAASLHQAKAKILDKQHNFQEAFENYARANQLKKGQGEKSGHLEDIKNSLSFFSPEVLKRLPHAANTSELPLFIVGMPRSGTTLVEQIIASHPEACGGGELPYINRFVYNLPGSSGTSENYPECLQSVDGKMLDAMATEYLDHLKRICPDAKRITDKLPHNFMWLGMIEIMFPHARVIHCVREPMDNCLSLYTTRGFNAHHSYAFDLEKLGEHYRKYEEIMSMWRNTLSLPMLEIQYESLVSDFENQVKRLVEFCGLDWNESCLHYHESERLSATLSYDQVRKPIYSSSVGRWRNYEDFLLPLKAALGRNGD